MTEDVWSICARHGEAKDVLQVEKKLGMQNKNIKSLLAVISRFSSQGTVFFLAHRTLAEH